MYPFPRRGEDSDRHVARTTTPCTVNAEEQTSFFKWMSKDYYGDVAKFAELRWFHSIAKQSKTGRTVERCSFGWKVETIR